MLSVRITWLLLSIAWIAAEIKLARANRIDHRDFSAKEEHSQRVLWITLVISLVMSLTFKAIALAPINIDYLPRQIIALFIFICGLALRHVAVRQLGCLFTTDAAIHNNHRLVVTGLYHWIRHPAYTGLIVAFAGAGLAMGDFIALLLLTLPTLIAFIYRISIEEKLLQNKFGGIYRAYCKNTKKMLPWVF